MKQKTIKELKEEIIKLKKEKEEKLLFAKTLGEKNKLLKEIKSLEEVSKSPSKIKQFGKTFKKGLNITGNKIWEAVKRGSRNIEMNNKNLQKLSRRKQNPNNPFSEIDKMMLPPYKPKSKKKQKYKKERLPWEMP